MPKKRNNPMFQVGTAVSVDVETGEETPIEGGGFRMLPGPPGSCEWCHVVHPPEDPHNQQSLPYQIKFKTIHGRYPTWTDAMRHCPPEVKRTWRQQLVELMTEKGMDIPDDLKD